MKFVLRFNDSFHNGKGGFVVRTLIMTIAILIATRLLPGVEVHSVVAAIGTAIVISALNNVVRPLLIFVTLPLSMFTMGLFLFIINAVIIWLADQLLGKWFEVDDFSICILFSLLLIALNYLIELPNRWLNRRHYEENKNISRDDSFSQIDSNDDDPDHFDDYEDLSDNQQQ